MRRIFCWIFGHSPRAFLQDAPSAGNAGLLYHGICHRCGCYHFGLRRPGTDMIFYAPRNPHFGIMGPP